MFKKIFVPLDGSGHSNEALHVATSLAKELDSELAVCYVVDVARVAALTGAYPVSLEPVIEAIEADGNAVLRRAEAEALPQHPKTYLLSGFPPEEIVQCANESGADLIVMGSHGRSGVRRLFVGSVTEAVLRLSHIPVLVSRKTRAARTGVQAAEMLEMSAI